MSDHQKFPPIHDSYKSVYGDGKEAEKRLNAVKEKFIEKYGNPPTYLVRSPGRVNIIGEHVDYCGYAVFPMAIEQDILIAASTNDEKIYKITNTNPQFNDYEIDVKGFAIDGHQWYHYALCGHKAIISECKLESPCGMNLMVDGNVPKSAGLSSSSALVCCSALTSMVVNGKMLEKLILAEACQKCEKYIGTESGGMDQAISILGEEGGAKLIEFNPLRTTDVALPDGAIFVIANSLREMNKSENAGEYYNKRVAECRIAAQVLAKSGGHEWLKIRRLVDAQNVLKKSLSEMVLLVKEVFHEKPYTREEICKILEIDDKQLIAECLNPTTAQAQEFKLYHRAKHVYSEAGRVWTFKKICEEKTQNSLNLLGDLMNASQESCAVDYECSCDELDELTKICRESGALGSRLTGAGWGGCTVSLVPSDIVDTFMQTVKARYYDCNEGRRNKIQEALFATKPGSGAAIIRL